MIKSKSSGKAQEVVLPDFPDDETTVTKSRRVSFGTNFIKEFIVGSAVSAQCMSEYEQAFPSSDSSNADSSHSTAESDILNHNEFIVHESLKIHKSVPTVIQPAEPDSVESRPKPPTFSSTICFSADSPTADMEFTEGCLTLAKSILDKKNKEMTVIIQAKPKEPKEEEKPHEEETKYFDGSEFEMSMTRCLKSKENKREEKRMDNEKTKIFSKFEDEMSITRCTRVLNEDDMSITRCNKVFNENDMSVAKCNKVFNENDMSVTRCSRVYNEDDSDSSLDDCKENQVPLDVIMHHLDKDNSDLENDLFNPEKTFSNLLNGSPFDFSNDSEKLNLNESMDISIGFQPQNKTDVDVAVPEAASAAAETTESNTDVPADTLELSENPLLVEEIKIDNSDQPNLNESMEISIDVQPTSDTDGFELQQNALSDDQMEKLVKHDDNQETTNDPNIADDSEQSSTFDREPLLVDVKVIESLKEQSKEPGCVWSLKDWSHPQVKTPGLLSFNCELLESTATIQFHLKISNEDGLDCCSIVKCSEVSLNEENKCRLPEYSLAIEFGFEGLKKFFDERRQKVETIRHVPYFLDQINSFTSKINSYLLQIYSILTLYPGSRLKGSLLSFRLYSFPVFFSCVVSIDLSDLFRLSKTSLVFENDFGSLDENKIREIFQDCLKIKNSLCEFVIQSTKYLIRLEKESGYVSKRQHIRLLPPELKL